MAPPFSSSNYDTIFSLTINSSNIINGTITGSDIANGTITNANIANGTITEAKLSSALQTKLSDFDTRLTALETPPPPVILGWFGTFIVSNVIASGSDPRHLNAYLAFNNIAISNTVEINGNRDYTFIIQGQDRLPLSTSTLQLKVIAQSETTGISVSAYDGFSITNFTSNPPTQENTLNMIVNSNKLINGELSASFTITYPPPAPPPGWSGTITFNRTTGGGDPYISLRTDTDVITTDYDYNNENGTFSLGLTTEESYVEIAFILYNDWVMYDNSFSPQLDEPYVYYDQSTDRMWYRYSIPTKIQSNLTYNFSTYDDS